MGGSTCGGAVTDIRGPPRFSHPHPRRQGRRPGPGYCLWYSGRHKAFGGSIHLVTDHTGNPVWTSSVESGSTHDIATVVVESRLCCVFSWDWKTASRVVFDWVG